MKSFKGKSFDMIIEKSIPISRNVQAKELPIQKNLLIPFAKKMNQKIESQNRDIRSKLKKINNFFENLPVSDELIFDEEDTIPFNPPLLERSNLFFPDFESNFESKIQEEKFDLDTKKKQKSLKRKCKFDEENENKKHVKIFSK